METNNEGSNSIKFWAEDDRPREKLAAKGAQALSNSELLGILINNGSKDKSAIDLAKEILKLGNDNLNDLGKLTIADFKKVKGIGQAKAVTIMAALELGKRRHSGVVRDMTVAKNSADIAAYLKTQLKDYSHEVFAVLYLNNANKIKNFEIVSQGGITGTVADPRIILRKALENGATALVLSHNHPSGNLKPSRADEELTTKLKHAASFMDIKVLDHIIVSEEGYYSFADEGML